MAVNDRPQRRGQGDGLGAARLNVEVDGVGARVDIGSQDRGPERAGAAVVDVVDQEDGKQPPVLQKL